MMMLRIERALGMLRMDLVQRAAQADWDDDQAEQVAHAVVACLRTGRAAPDDHAPAPGATLTGAALRGVVRYVDAHLDSKLKWEEIAAAVGLDAFRFGRGFKLATGMTPHQYVVRCRVRRAMRLLVRTESSIADVALEVGCSCQSHLTTLFRKHAATTPAAFRRAARAGREARAAAAPGAARLRRQAAPADARPAQVP